jgi:hypothetical protein
MNEWAPLAKTKPTTHATTDASTEKTNARTPEEECVRSETSTSDALFFFFVVVVL